MEAVEPNGDDSSVFHLGTPLYSGYNLVLGICNCYLGYDRPGSTGAGENVNTIELSLPYMTIAKTVDPVWAIARFMAEQAIQGH